jgi:serine/threonine protein kinase
MSRWIHPPSSLLSTEENRMNSLPFPDGPVDEEMLEKDVDMWPTAPDPEIERVQPLVAKLSEQARGLESTIDPRGSGGTGPETVAPEGDGREAEALPARIGRYEIVARLGAGGMGVVFRAHDPALHREVALKLPRLAGFGEGEGRARQRFLRESRAAAGVRHPHLCPIYDVGEHEGRPFVVMELVDGASLHERLKQGRFEDARAAATLLVQVARALEAVHEHGLIHRDLKPGNILMDRQGRPYLTDFGLARPLEGNDRLTSEGVTPGTPRYMAPEQIDPALGELGPASDLYSLGVVLYEMLAGRPPFTGSLSALFCQITRDDPPSLTDFRPDLDPALVACIHKSMSRRPQDRFASAGEFADALESWLSGMGVTASVRSRPAGRRRKTRVFVGLAGVLAGIGVLVPFVLNRDTTSVSTSPPPQPASESLPVLARRADGALELSLQGAPARVSTQYRDGKPILVIELPLLATQSSQKGANSLRVRELRVKHYANIQGRWDQFTGVLGERSFVTHLHDSVDIESRLSRSAYAYLIAFRPDGTEELCFPEKAEEPPALSDHPRYPSVTPSDVNYGLDEGEGFQVFAVVASDQRLPAYNVWRAKRGDSPWKKFLRSQPDGHNRIPAPDIVWIDDGEKVVPLVNDVSKGQRGKGREMTGKAPLRELTQWLRQDRDVTTVAAIGFAVLPKPD